MNSKFLMPIVLVLVFVGGYFFFNSSENIEPYFVDQYQGIVVETFYGNGDSMYPLLKNGDVVSLQKIPFEDLKAGMIVVYQKNQFVKVCHVLIRLESDGWVSKGINNSFEDSVFVKSSNYIGVLTK